MKRFSQFDVLIRPVENGPPKEGLHPLPIWANARPLSQTLTYELCSRSSNPGIPRLVRPGVSLVSVLPDRLLRPALASLQISAQAPAADIPRPRSCHCFPPPCDRDPTCARSRCAPIPFRFRSRPLTSRRTWSENFRFLAGEYRTCLELEEVLFGE